MTRITSCAQIALLDFGKEGISKWEGLSSIFIFVHFRKANFILHSAVR